MPTTTAPVSPEEQAKFGNGLTTTLAPFIEQAKSRGELYIEQPYELYSEENHRSWRLLYKRMLEERWPKYANEQFLEGVKKLCFDPDLVPKLEDVNQFLAPLTGFKARAVSGYIPAYLFFDCLRQREFPTTITIRRSDSLDYLPEPDIFHDIAGHVPMHTDKAFADILVRFGETAQSAAQMVKRIDDEERQLAAMTSIIKAMARFFWFSIEFGLMKRDPADKRDQPELCVYGSGLLSSYGEIAHCIESAEVQRYPFQMEWVINQYFEIDRYQPLLFYVDSFDHLFTMVDELEAWLQSGRLNNVSPGEPAVSEQDLKSFLEAEA